MGFFFKRSINSETTRIKTEIQTVKDPSNNSDMILAVCRALVSKDVKIYTKRSDLVEIEFTLTEVNGKCFITSQNGLETGFIYATFIPVLDSNNIVDIKSGSDETLNDFILLFDNREFVIGISPVQGPKE